jgi:hypothetical protein
MNTQTEPKKDIFTYSDYLNELQNTSAKEFDGTVLNQKLFTTPQQRKIFWAGFDKSLRMDGLYMLIIFILSFFILHINIAYIIVAQLIILAFIITKNLQFLDQKTKLTNKIFKKFYMGYIAGSTIFFAGLFILTIIITQKNMINTFILKSIVYIFTLLDITSKIFNQQKIINIFKNHQAGLYFISIFVYI